MKQQIKIDQRFMDEALTEAAKGCYTAHPNPRVGCVFVKDNQIVARGYHLKTGQAHAEINAIEQACDSLKDTTCYVTLEPCAHFGRTPPCVDALIAQGIARCVIASCDPNPQVNGASIQKMREQGIQVDVGVCEAKALALNAGFFKRMRHNLPNVVAKVAVSMDGKTAMQNGQSQWITSKEARQDAHHLRAQVGAIVTSAKTVKDDDPSMTARLESLPKDFVQPMRVILDTSLKTCPSARILKQPGKTVLAISEAVSQDKVLAFMAQVHGDVQIQTFNAIEDHIDLKALLHWLAKEQVNDVLLEAGPNLMGHWIEQNLVDELVVYMAPKLMGAQTKGMFDLNLSDLSEHISLDVSSIERVGPDIKIKAQIKR